MSLITLYSCSRIIFCETIINVMDVLLNMQQALEPHHFLLIHHLEFPCLYSSFWLLTAVLCISREFRGIVKQVQFCFVPMF